MIVVGGSTDVTTYFQMRLLAGGDGTGLTLTDFDLTYVRTGATPAAKVDAVALAAANTAHTDNRGIEVDSTNQKGLYRFDWPDAAFAAGVREVILTVKHTSCFTESLRVEIDPVVQADLAKILGVAVSTTTAQLGVNAVQISGLASAADDLEAWTLGMITGVSDSGTTTTMVDAARTEADTDYWKGAFILFTSGNIAGQTRLITAFDAATDTFTLYPALTQAAATQNYIIIPAAAVNVGQWASANLATVDAAGYPVVTVKDGAGQGELNTSNGRVSADVARWNGTVVATENTPGIPIVDMTRIAGVVQTVNLNTIGGYLDTEIASILAAVDTEIAAILAAVDTEVGSILTAVNALNNLSAAQVNAEIVDALNVDTYAEPSGVPGATASLVTKIGYLHMGLRNRIDITGSTKTFYDDAGNVEWSKALSDDGVTYSEAEAA